LEPTYTSQYVALLAGAIPLNDSQPYFVQYLQEYQQTFFSFTPWWSMAENRTLVLAADVIFNDIFFYAAANDYPLYYDTALIDKDNVIAIEADRYELSQTFYTMVRPNFALYDLISQRQYIFYFFAFSQVLTTEENGLVVDLYCGQTIYGYANSSSVFYRHFMIDNNSTLNITVNPVSGSIPKLVITTANEAIWPSSEAGNYQMLVEQSAEGQPLTFVIDPTWLYS
jgi:hypothetical protein